VRPSGRPSRAGANGPATGRPTRRPGWSPSRPTGRAPRQGAPPGARTSGRRPGGARLPTATPRRWSERSPTARSPAVGRPVLRADGPRATALTAGTTRESVDDATTRCPTRSSRLDPGAASRARRAGAAPVRQPATALPATPDRGIAAGATPRVRRRPSPHPPTEHTPTGTDRPQTVAGPPGDGPRGSPTSRRAGVAVTVRCGTRRTRGMPTARVRRARGRPTAPVAPGTRGLRSVGPGLPRRGEPGAGRRVGARSSTASPAGDRLATVGPKVPGPSGRHRRRRPGQMHPDSRPRRAMRGGRLPAPGTRVGRAGRSAPGMRAGLPARSEPSRRRACPAPTGPVRGARGGRPGRNHRWNKVGARHTSGRPGSEVRQGCRR
jgi:hypothetical protein